MIVLSAPYASLVFDEPAVNADAITMLFCGDARPRIVLSLAGTTLVPGMWFPGDISAVQSFLEQMTVGGRTYVVAAADINTVIASFAAVDFLNLYLRLETKVNTGKQTGNRMGIAGLKSIISYLANHTPSDDATLSISHGN